MLPSSTVCAVDDQVSCELGGEAAILDLQQGVYYGLDPVGATIWNLIAQPRRVDEIKQALLDQYEVSPDQCERDLIELLNDLAEHGLIRVENEAAG
ncbi:MAG: PqqD family protein [Candidatus Binataceae bacterium]|nr:PqqD family protein [Candidatus Binataceae bacterium]